MNEARLSYANAITAMILICAQINLDELWKNKDNDQPKHRARVMSRLIFLISHSLN